MKVLVCYRINEHSTKMAGVFQKMLGQLEGFSAQENIEVYAMYMSRNRFLISKYNKGKLQQLVVREPIAIKGERDRFWRLGIEHLNTIQPDIVYCRYDNQYDTDALTDFVTVCKQVAKSINIVEFPTYPYEQEISDEANLAGDIKRRPGLLNALEFVASTYNSPTLLGKKNAYFSNKIDVEKMRLDCFRQSIGVNGVVNLLALANISDWHGYDRLIHGIALYAKLGSKPDVHLHLVGDGNALDKLKDLINKLAIEQHVSVYGFIEYEKLAPIFEKCHAGIDSLGLHRKGLTHSCSLKTRSYVANGLPVITAAIDDDLDGQPWVLKLDSDESPICISDIVGELKEIYKTPHLHTTISDFAEAHLSWSNHASIILEYSRQFQRQIVPVN